MMIDIFENFLLKFIQERYDCHFLYPCTIERFIAWLTILGKISGSSVHICFSFCSQKKFEIEEVFKRFEKYDTWAKMEYDFSVQVR